VLVVINQCKLKNKKPAQNGVYKWVIACKDYNGVEHTKSGNVNIIK